MKIRVRSFWEPKAGNRPEQYEDAFWPYWPYHIAVERSFRFAVADGATEAAFSRLWARLLVLLSCGADLTLSRAASQNPPNRVAEMVAARAKRWEKEVFQKSNRPLPWFTVEKAQRGSFSSLLSITLSNDLAGDTSRGQWEAFAVGDSCLFQLHAGELVKRWPVTSPDQFGYHPLLLSTHPGKNTQVWSDPSALTTHGNWQVGDEFVLMTDALAEWYMRSAAKGDAPPVEYLPPMELADTNFSESVTRLRKSGGLRNDDVTLVRIQILAEI